MNVIGFDRSGMIRAVFDNEEHETIVPDDMGNRHRARIWDEWEMAPQDPETGERQRVNTIPPYVPPPPSADDVDAERDRRIAAGFTFAGVTYQTRPSDRENIAGASTAALGAMMAGAEPGDLRWHGGDSDFAWIAADNSMHAMDAHTMFAFGQAAMGHKQVHIFAARAIKDLSPIPADFADDSRWP